MECGRLKVVMIRINSRRIPSLGHSLESVRSPG